MVLLTLSLVCSVIAICMVIIDHDGAHSRENEKWAHYGGLFMILSTVGWMSFFFILLYLSP